MSKNPDKTTPATANAGTEQNIAADVDEVMRKYDRLQRGRGAESRLPAEIWGFLSGAAV